MHQLKLKLFKAVAGCNYRFIAFCEYYVVKRGMQYKQGGL